jgi:hypothetical protein
MKYMIMLFGSQQDYDALSGKPSGTPPMSPEQIAAMHSHMGTLHQRLSDSGELVDAHGLTAPVHARRVMLAHRADPASGDATPTPVPVVTDGPYAETQEVLAGYTIVECASIDRALRIAAEFINPDAPDEYVDVRPILDGIEDLDA